MKIIVCGGRNYTSRHRVKSALDWLNSVVDITVVATGESTFADVYAEAWAKENYCELDVYKADWETYGTKARLRRNVHMLDSVEPDMVVVFPGDRGTEHMCKIAIEAGYTVLNVGDHVGFF